MSKVKNLLVIHHEDVQVVLKGKYEPSNFIKGDSDIHMRLISTIPPSCFQVYDGQDLVAYEGQNLAPIFFENGSYELAIRPLNGAEIGFHHEYSHFQDAISEFLDTGILMGALDFFGEVGLSEFEIVKDYQTLFTFTIEVFPTKLDYQRDYIELLDQVNDEIYNLAYAFIKKTYLNAARKQYKDPTYAEFYQLIVAHIEDFQQAIAHVEYAPHHQLETRYEEVRGEKLRRQDSKGLRYLRNNAKHFVDVTQGIPIGQRTMMPTKGLLIKKEQNFDTHENRYVKWAMERTYSRLKQLKENYLAVAKKNAQSLNKVFLEKLDSWILFFQQTLQKPFWRKVGKLDRSVYSLVMQMGTGYKEVFQIYMFVSQSLVLQNDLYKMSVKDIAKIYEYWTFLKLAKILNQRTNAISQDIVQVKNNGLYLNLTSGQMVTRVFEQPLTKEKITLCYQYRANDTPTINQEPDTMLSIEKRGSKGVFRYIFDAKYRLHVDKQGNIGPKHDDINVMHRYRDAIVAKTGASYEREMFGAYVLFPGKNDAAYEQHDLYKSIEKVNIGGLPFLPNDTQLVEQIIDNLLYKSADELQREGILPKGTLSYLTSRQGEILVVHEQLLLENVWGMDDFGPEIVISKNQLPQDAIRAKELAIANNAGIYKVFEILAAEVTFDNVIFTILNEQSHMLGAQKNYEWSNGILLPLTAFDLADCFEEIFVKNEMESKIVRLFKRLSKEVQIVLASNAITEQSQIVQVMSHSILFELIGEELVCGERRVSLNLPEFELFSWVHRCITSVDKKTREYR